MCFWRLIWFKVGGLTILLKIFLKSSNYYFLPFDGLIWIFVYVLAEQALNPKHSAKQYEWMILEILRRSGFRKWNHLIFRSDDKWNIRDQFKNTFFKSDNTHSQSHTLWLAIATANIIISVFLSRYYVIVRTIMESEKI